MLFIASMMDGAKKKSLSGSGLPARSLGRFPPGDETSVHALTVEFQDLSRRVFGVTSEACR